MEEKEIALQAGEGVCLEARVGLIEGARGGLVICHPHPLYGGDMDNPVVVRAAEVCRETGISTLRFNFRGVGRSTGSHGHGKAEEDDLRAGVAALQALLPPGCPLGLAGYSFGAWIAARVAAGLRPPGLGLIAPPLSRFEFAALEDEAATDLLLVAGTRDPYCPPEAFAALAARLPRAEAVTLDGADHFFFGKLFPLGEAIRGWARRWARG